MICLPFFLCNQVTTTTTTTTVYLSCSAVTLFERLLSIQESELVPIIECINYTLLQRRKLIKREGEKKLEKPGGQKVQLNRFFFIFISIATTLRIS